MEVDITIGSGTAFQKASQRGLANKKGVPSTPTLSQAIAANPGVATGSGGVGVPGTPNLLLVTPEMTPNGCHPYMQQRAGSTTMEDDTWQRDRVEEVDEEDQDFNHMVEIEEVGASNGNINDRISIVKEEDDDDDICQIDKNTTERSCQSPIQLINNRDLCF